MIAKNKKGRSFGGCVRYVLNERHEILEAEGVLAEDAASIIRNFAIQRSGRPEIKQPVGHIAVAFSPEDSWKMSNTFMLKLAHEYMEAMNICNTQFVIVRHHNTDHDHFHIVYNRIDNDLKLISVNHDYKRNIKVCKKLKDKYKLTYGKGKEKVNRQKLKGADKVKYQIHDEIVANLPRCVSYEDLEKRLRQADISIQYKYRSGAIESPENIQGISFKKGNYSFKGSEIDRKFSHANITKAFDKNMSDLLKYIMEPDARPTEKQAMPSVAPLSEPPKSQKSHTPEAPKQPEHAMKTTTTPEQKPAAPSRPAQSPIPSGQHRHFIRGGETTVGQWEKLQSGDHIFVENMDLEDGSGGKFSAYVFLDDDKRGVFYSPDDPDKFVKYGRYEMRLRDKMQIEQGFVVRAKVKWYGGEFAHPYLWKDKPDDTEYKESWNDPRIPKEQLEKERQAFENRFRRPPATSRTPPTVNRTIPPPRTIPSKRASPPPKKKGPKISR